jgi:acyl-CoA thioesterase
MSETTKTREISQSDLEKAKRAFKTIPFVQLVGMELVDLNDGEATVKLEMRDELRQPHGILHGGATASVIDTAMAFAVVTRLSQDEKASTVDLTVHYLRPVVEGEIVCTAKVVRGGRRLLTVSVDVFNQDK